MDAELIGRALLTATAANPGDLVPRIRELFVEQTAAIDLALHLIDYRLGSLRPSGIGDVPVVYGPETLLDSPAGEAFRMQRLTRRPVPAGYLVHVPVTVRGQRLGVLTATFSDRPSDEDVRTLRSIGWALAHSLIESGTGTDVYEVDRRHARLSLSAEMQWQLLPARAYRTGDFFVAGHLEPALRVAGDAFDFVVNHRVLTLAVIDATATERETALPTTLAVTALRNARRSSLPLADQVELAGEIVWQHTRGAEHVTALLLQLDCASEQAWAVDAGSPTLLRARDGAIEVVPLDEQTPLGMFADTAYRAEPIDLRPGDRLYALTDGAFARHEFGTIVELLQAQQSDEPLPPPESIRRLVADLTGDNGEAEDDITVVCVDWLEPG